MLLLTDSESVLPVRRAKGGIRLLGRGELKAKLNIEVTSKPQAVDEIDRWARGDAERHAGAAGDAAVEDVADDDHARGTCPGGAVVRPRERLRQIGRAERTACTSPNDRAASRTSMLAAIVDPLCSGFNLEGGERPGRQPGG